MSGIWMQITVVFETEEFRLLETKAQHQNMTAAEFVRDAALFSIKEGTSAEMGTGSSMPKRDRGKAQNNSCFA